MADIHWRNAVNGKFTKPANWSGNEAPGENDNAILDAAGNPYIVTFNSDSFGDIGGLRLASNATLKVEERGFATDTIVNAGVIVVNTVPGGALGFDALVNAGTILVNAVLETSDPYGDPNICDNSGVIRISGAAGQTVELSMIGFGTLTGGGQIILGDNGSLNTNNTIINVDNTISGNGEIYGSVLVNDAAGVIDASDDALLTINSSRYTITNAGTIETTGSGGVVIESRLDNTGELIASTGTLECTQAVSGAGVAVIDGGTLDFTKLVSQDVIFSAGGTLELAEPRKFFGSVTGFSTSGMTTLDLGGIRFVDPGQATFSGTTSAGVLTVTDGTHTANITLQGDYLDATFVASKDGHGTDVIALSKNSSTAPVHALIAAMAGFGPPGCHAIHTGESVLSRNLLLTSPRAAIA